MSSNMFRTNIFKHPLIGVNWRVMILRRGLLKMSTFLLLIFINPWFRDSVHFDFGFIFYTDNQSQVNIGILPISYIRYSWWSTCNMTVNFKRVTGSRSHGMVKQLRLKDEEPMEWCCTLHSHFFCRFCFWPSSFIPEGLVCLSGLDVASNAQYWSVLSLARCKAEVVSFPHATVPFQTHNYSTD